MKEFSPDTFHYGKYTLRISEGLLRIFPRISILLVFFIFFKGYLLIYLRERESERAQTEGGAEGEGEPDSPAEQGAQRRALSQDPWIMT